MLAHLTRFLSSSFARPLRIPHGGWASAKLLAPARGAGQVVDGRLGVVEEHIPAETRGITLAVHVCEVGAILERRVPDVGDLGGDRHATQTGALAKRVNPDVGEVGGEDDVGQTGATLERGVPDALDAVGNRDADKLTAKAECPLTDSGDAIGDRDASPSFAGTQRFRAKSVRFQS